jgi:hypothetical protein
MITYRVKHLRLRKTFAFVIAPNKNIVAKLSAKNLLTLNNCIMLSLKTTRNYRGYLKQKGPPKEQEKSAVAETKEIS